MLPLKFVFRLLMLMVTLALAGCFSTAETLPTPMPDSPLTTVQPILTPAPTLDPQMAALPLSIDYLRSRQYDGSDLVFEETLEAGSNYNRYIVSYRSDGLKIYALLTIPWAVKSASGYPVVIFNHGYIPPDQYRTTERYVAYVDAFARAGYIVLKSDYRGHGSSEGQPTSIYGDPGYVVDVLNALASIRRYSDADPNRIGMWGHSMGGYITLRAMVVDPHIKAGVIWAGVVAPYSELFQSWFGGNTAGNNRPRWLNDLVNQYGTPEANPVFWDALSANAYLSNLSGPVQIHHGTGDTTVPYSYSVMLDAEIKAAGRSSELFLYPDDDHNIATHRDDALILSVVFFNQHVKNASR